MPSKSKNGMWFIANSAYLFFSKLNFGLTSVKSRIQGKSPKLLGEFIIASIFIYIKEVAQGLTPGRTRLRKKSTLRRIQSSLALGEEKDKLK